LFVLEDMNAVYASILLKIKANNANIKKLLQILDHKRVRFFAFASVDKKFVSISVHAVLI